MPRTTSQESRGGQLCQAPLQAASRDTVVGLTPPTEPCFDWNLLHRPDLSRLKLRQKAGIFAAV